jgi:SpoIID/LytB domain protein
MALLVGLALLAAPLPLAAQETAPLGYLEGEVQLIPVGGTRFTINDRVYGGTLRVSGHSAGLALVEIVGLDQYLLGIREVPFSWHGQALRAQVVAARTYLAWTLGGGRSSNGRAYDYDICATDACQVYAGVGAVSGPEGGRWASAVADTSDQVLLYQGAPAQAVYSSTSGGRTRNSGDVWGGDDIPYLQAVESPGEESPYVTWEWEVDAERMERLLGEAGVVTGNLRDISTVIVPDGQGPWRVAIASDGGTRTLGTWDLRGMINSAARRTMADVLPAYRPNGRRYPQTMMSPSYTIRRVGLVVAGPDGEPERITKGYRVEGRGWGHLVGMSQYGAQAMAQAGSSYGQILAHYYGGLSPQAAPEILPDLVEVGLAIESSEMVIGADGPVQVVTSGNVVSEAALGTWRFVAEGSDVRVIPPEGLGLAPDLSRPVVERNRGGDPASIGFTLRAPAEVRITVFQGSILAGRRDLGVTDAGTYRFRWSELVSTGPAGPAAYRVLIEATSPDGEDRLHLTLLNRAE